MRPNIQISHALNGRVKDYAAEHDLGVDEAYRRIIQAGLHSLRTNDELVTAADGGRNEDEDTEAFEPITCSVCGERVESWDEAKEHARDCLGMNPPSSR